MAQHVASTGGQQIHFLHASQLESIKCGFWLPNLRLNTSKFVQFFVHVRVQLLTDILHPHQCSTILCPSRFHSRNCASSIFNGANAKRLNLLFEAGQGILKDKSERGEFEKGSLTSAALSEWVLYQQQRAFSLLEFCLQNCEHSENDQCRFQLGKVLIFLGVKMWTGWFTKNTAQISLDAVTQILASALNWLEKLEK